MDLHFTVSQVYIITVIISVNIDVITRNSDMCTYLIRIYLIIVISHQLATYVCMYVVVGYLYLYSNMHAENQIHSHD